MIYASERYSTAMLEKLVHGRGRLPPNQHYVEITIPSGISYEVLSTAHQRGWDDEDCLVGKAYGDVWQQSSRSLRLIVPSVIARMERNVLINPTRPELPNYARAT